MALTKISTAMWNSVPHHLTHDFNVDDVLIVDVSENKVGIGTDSPSAKLDVEGTDAKIEINNTTTGITDLVLLDLTGTVTGSGVGNERAILLGKSGNSARQAKIAYSQNTSNGQLPSLSFFTGDNVDSLDERMRINSGGDISFRDTSNNEAFYWDASTARLGIGTTSPADSLVVIGDIGVGSGDYNGGIFANINAGGVDKNWGFEVQRTANTSDYNTRLKYYPQTGDSRKAGIYNSQTNSFSLYSDSNNTPNIIIPDGNLGIGTNSPSQKLTVEGNIELGTGGYIYGDTTNPRVYLNNANGAFLMYGGSSYIGVGSSNVSASVNIHAPAFYDFDNTSYYVNPAGTSIQNFIKIYSTVPQLAIEDSNNAGGGGASGLITFRNTGGRAIGIGYTSNETSNSDLIISTNAASTYGGYLGLDAAAISDTQADIILDPKTEIRAYGHIDMNANDINYVSQLHFNDNVRFYDAGNDSYLNFKYGDAATGGIKFYNGGDTLKGYVYANSSGFGLLSSIGQWGLRIPDGGSGLELRSANNVEFTVNNNHTLSHGSSRAPIFYDSDNTGYYVDPASTSKFETINILDSASTHGVLHTSDPYHGLTMRGYPNTSNTTAMTAGDYMSFWEYGGIFRFYKKQPSVLTLQAWIDNGSITATADARAPIFYDSNNTAFYANPASTSEFNQIDARYFDIEANPAYSVRFWGGSHNYSIRMSQSSNSTYGGRVAGETTSDYNMYFTMTGGTNRGFVFRNTTSSSGTVAGIDASGNGRFIGDVVAYSSSDERLKDNKKNIDNALEKVESLNGIEFDWNDEQDVYSGHDIGVIAQEVEKVLPEIVNTRDTGYKAVKYEKLVPLLIEAVKELSEKVKILENK